MNWRTCAHTFRPFFGPVLKCIHCGATTMVSMDGKSKPIHPLLSAGANSMSMEWRGGNHIVPPDYRDDHLPEEEDGPPQDDICPRCHGDGGDPMCDYLLPCPVCGGDGSRWSLS